MWGYDFRLGGGVGSDAGQSGELEATEWGEVGGGPVEGVLLAKHPLAASLTPAELKGRLAELQRKQASRRPFQPTSSCPSCSRWAPLHTLQD